MTTEHASPLQEIERQVQARAKETALDMAGDGGRAKLRSLIAEEVIAWSEGYKRGLRAFDLSDPETVAERAYRNLAGYGPLEPLLADDDVWEIMVNSPDQIFVKRHRGTSGYHDEAFNDFSALRRGRIQASWPIAVRCVGRTGEALGRASSPSAVVRSRSGGFRTGR